MKVTERAKQKSRNSIKLADCVIKDLFGRLLVITDKDPITGIFYQRRYLLSNNLNCKMFRTLPMK